MIPYARHQLDEEDILAVTNVLRSDWLTTGPNVETFERAISEYTGAAHAVALSSGTAALHAAMHAAGVALGDEVIVPAMTFVATANAVVFQGGTPVFADVEPDTLLLDPLDAEARITAKTKAIVAVDYAGQPCDYHTLRAICARHGLLLISDACHSLGALYKGRPVGTLADMTVFSFHPAKAITTGEGGMVVTSDGRLASRIRAFRNHGILSSPRERESQGTWFYEMVELGYNYRLTDLQSALGTSQLRKLPRFLARRREIAALYDAALRRHERVVSPLGVTSRTSSAHHLYVIQLRLEALTVDRAALFLAFRREGIGVNVHYVPVHLHPFYRARYGHREGECPAAEGAYQRILSLPMNHALSDEDVRRVIEAGDQIWTRFATRC